MTSLLPAEQDSLYVEYEQVRTEREKNGIKKLRLLNLRYIGIWGVMLCIHTHTNREINL